MEILTTERVDFAGYKRLAANVVAPDATDDELQGAAERFLRRERVETVVMFVWSSRELAGQVPYDVARVQIARSTRRWTSDGEWLAGTVGDEQVTRLRRRRIVIERREPEK